MEFGRIKVTTSASALGYIDPSNPEDIALEGLKSVLRALANEARQAGFSPHDVSAFLTAATDDIQETAGKGFSAGLVREMEIAKARHEKADLLIRTNPEYRDRAKKAIARKLGVREDQVVRLITEAEAKDIMSSDRQRGLNMDTLAVIKRDDGTHEIYVPDMKGAGTFSTTEDKHSKLAMQQALYLPRLFTATTDAQFEALTGLKRDSSVRPGDRAIFVNTDEFIDKANYPRPTVTSRPLDSKAALEIDAKIVRAANIAAENSPIIQHIVNHAGRQIPEMDRTVVSSEIRRIAAALGSPSAQPNPDIAFRDPIRMYAGRNAPVKSNPQIQAAFATRGQQRQLVSIKLSGSPLVANTSSDQETKFSTDEELLHYLSTLTTSELSEINLIGLRDPSRPQMMSLLGALRKRYAPEEIDVPESHKDMTGTRASSIELYGTRFNVGDAVAGAKIVDIRTINPNRQMLYVSDSRTGRSLIIPVDRTPHGTLLNNIPPIPTVEVEGGRGAHNFTMQATSPQSLSAEQALEIAILEATQGRVHTTRMNSIANLSPAGQVMARAHMIVQQGGKVNLGKIDPRFAPTHMFFPRTELERLLGDSTEDYGRVAAIPIAELLGAMESSWSTKRGAWLGTRGVDKKPAKLAKLVKRELRPRHYAITEGFEMKDVGKGHYGVRMVVLGAGMMPQGMAIMVMPPGTRGGSLHAGVDMRRNIKVETGSDFVPSADDWIPVRDGIAIVGTSNGEDVKIRVGNIYDKIRLNTGEGGIWYNEDGISIGFTAAAPSVTSKSGAIKINETVYSVEEAANFLGISEDKVIEMWGGDTSEPAVFTAPDNLKSSAGIAADMAGRIDPDMQARLSGASHEDLYAALQNLFSLEDNENIATGIAHMTDLRSIEALIAGAEGGELSVPWASFPSSITLTAEASSGRASINPNMAAWYATYFPEYYKLMQRANYSRAAMDKETVWRAAELNIGYYPDKSKLDDVINLEDYPEVLDIFMQGGELGDIFREAAKALGPMRHRVLSINGKYLPSAQAMAQMSTVDPNTGEETNPFIRTAYSLIATRGGESAEMYEKHLGELARSDTHMRNMFQLKLPHATYGPYHGHTRLVGGEIYIPPHQLQKMIPGLSKVLSSAAPEEQLGILRNVYKVLSGEVIHGNRQPLLDIMYGLAGLKFVDPFEHEGLEDIASQLSRDPLSRSLQMGVSSGVYEQFAADTDFDALTVGFARAVRAQVGEEGGIELLFGKHGRTKSSTVEDIESVTPDKMRELRYGRSQMEEDILNRFREAGAIYGPLGERVTDLNMMARYATLRFAQARMRPQDALELEEIAMAGEGIPDAAIKFLASKQVPGSQLGALFGDRGISGDKPVDTEMLREMLHFPKTFEDFKKQIVSPEQLAQAGKALTVSKRDMGSPFGLLRSMASLFFAEFGADDFITDKPGFYRDISAVAQVYQSLLDLDQLTREEGAALGMMRVKMSAGGNLTYRNAATGEWETPVGNPAGFVSNVLGIRTESGRKAIARLMTAQGQMAARIQAGFKKPAGMMGVAEDDAQSVTYNDGAVGLYLGYGDEVRDKFILGVRDLMANTSLEALEAAVKFMEAGATPLRNKNIPEKDQVFAHIQPTEQEILEWLGNNPDSTEMIIGMMSGKRPPSHSGSRGTASGAGVVSGAGASAVDFFAGLSKSFESALARVFGGDFGENLKVYVHDREPAVQAINMSGMYAYGAMGAPEGLLDSARRVQDKSFKSGALSLMRGNVTNYNLNQIRHISNLLGFLGSSEEIAHGFVSTEFGEDGGPNQSAVDMLFGKEGPWSKYLVSAIQDVGREVTNARPSDVPRVQEHIENLANIGTEMAEASKRFATVSEVEGDAADRAAKQLSNLSGVIATTSEAMKTGLDSMFAPDTGLIAEYTQTLKDGVPILEAHLSKMQNLASGEGRLTAEQQRERAEASEFLRNYRSMSGAAGAPMPEQVQDLELAIDKVGILRSRPEQSGVKGIWEKLSDPRKSFGSDMYFMMRNMRMFVEPMVSGGQQYMQYQVGMNQLRATTGAEPDLQAREVSANMGRMQLARARSGGYILSGLNGGLGEDGLGSQSIADATTIGGVSIGLGLGAGQLAAMAAGVIPALSAVVPYVMPLVIAGTAAVLTNARITGESKNEPLMQAQLLGAARQQESRADAILFRERPEGMSDLDWEIYQRYAEQKRAGAETGLNMLGLGAAAQKYQGRTGYGGSAQFREDLTRVDALLKGARPESATELEYIYGEGAVGPEYAGLRAMIGKEWADRKEFAYGLGSFLGVPAAKTTGRSSIDPGQVLLPEEVMKPFVDLQQRFKDGGMEAGKLNSMLINMAVSMGKVGDEIVPFIADFLEQIKGEDFQKLAGMGLLPQYMEEYAGAESNAMKLGTGPSWWAGRLLSGGLGITQREDYQRYLQLAQGLASYGVTLNEPGSLAGPGEAAAYMEKEQLVGQAGQFLYNKTVMPSDQISAVLNGLQAGGTEDNYQLRLQLRAFSGDATAAYQLQQMQSAPSNLLAINEGDAYIDRPIKMSYSSNPGRELFDRSTLPIQISAPFGKLGGVQNNIGGLGALPWFYQGMESTGQPLFATQKVFGDTSPGQAMLGQYNQQLGKLGMGSMSYIPDRQSLSIQAWQSGYDATMASIGSTIAGIKERMEKLPDIRFWQDELRTISIDSANRDLEFQQRALDLNIAQQREGFALSQEQITTKSQWLTEDTARARGRLGTQTSWQAEDYAANKAMSQMQFGWKMQDIQRDLRFATGPQREALLRQQERETIGFNFQQAQADKQFGRGMTQAGWSLEDIGINEERQRKSIEWEQRRLDMSMKYFELESALQQERINAAMEDNGRRIEAETKLRDIQREMEDNDLRRSLAAAGAQAAHAKEMHNIEGQVRAIDMLQRVMNGLQVVHIMKMTTDSFNLFASIETGTTKVQKDFEEKVNPALDLATEKLADVSGVVLQFSEGWETFGTDIETWFNVVWGGENGLWNRKFSTPWHEFMNDFDLWIRSIQLPTGGGGGGGGGINPGGNNEMRALGGPILHPTVSALAEHGEEYVIPSHGQLVLRGGSGRDTELLSMILATLMRIEAAGLRFVTVDARGATTGVKTDSLYMLLNTA